MNNAILIYEVAGKIETKFCPEAEAQAHLVVANEKMEAASMFAIEGEQDAEFMLKVAPGVKSRVDEAIVRAKAQVKLRTALDEQGVPRDYCLRKRIHWAYEQMERL